MIRYTVLLKCGTIGTIDSNHSWKPEDFRPRLVTVQTSDENGMPIEVFGKFDEVLDEVEF